MEIALTILEHIYVYEGFIVDAISSISKYICSICRKNHIHKKKLLNVNPIINLFITSIFIKSMTIVLF